jgi:hypothetical protein
MAIIDRMTKMFQITPKFLLGRPKKFSHQLWQLKVGDQKNSVINYGDQKLTPITQFNDRKIKIGDRIHFRSPHTMGATQMYWVYAFVH